jgi:hypothetical protein
VVVDKVVGERFHVDIAVDASGAGVVCAVFADAPWADIAPRASGSLGAELDAEVQEQHRRLDGPLVHVSREDLCAVGDVEVLGGVAPEQVLPLGPHGRMVLGLGLLHEGALSLQGRQALLGEMVYAEDGAAGDEVRRPEVLQDARDAPRGVLPTVRQEHANEEQDEGPAPHAPPDDQVDAAEG